MDLVAIEEIKRLKYRYFRTLDLKKWDEFGDCLTEDIEARYGTQAMEKPVHFDTRADVVAFMSENFGEGVVTVHVASHPELDVAGGISLLLLRHEDRFPATDSSGLTAQLRPTANDSKPRAVLSRMPAWLGEVRGVHA